MTEPLTGYDLTAQRLLQGIFDGGCSEPCLVGRCTCREELAGLMRAAYDKGRQEALHRLQNAPAEQAASEWPSRQDLGPRAKRSA